MINVITKSFFIYLIANQGKETDNKSSRDSEYHEIICPKKIYRLKCDLDRIHQDPQKCIAKMHCKPDELLGPWYFHEPQ